METEKGWNDLPLTLGTAGVPPTHEIKLTNGKKLGDSDRKKMRNNMKMPRPGRVPWASFKYYYRLEAFLPAFLPLSHDIVDQIGTAALAMKVSEAHPSKSLLSTAKSDTSALIKSGPENPESSRAPSLVPSSSSEEPLTAVASKLQTKDGSNKGENCRASPSFKDENLRPWLFEGKSAEKVEQVRPKIDPQVVSIVAQHKPRSDHTLFDQTRQEPLLPASNRSLENGPSFASPSPNIHATQRIFPHHLPRPDSLQHVKRNAKEVEALRAKVKELQSERDEAQRKSKEERKKTEMLASRLEAEWTELLISKADLECQIVESKNAIATQLREQKELAGSVNETLGDISAGPGE
ncbi:hypothetical protein MMC22_006601 [Lobaria immixta]|nr:hypothetical protein [Lobaria immixta]